MGEDEGLDLPEAPSSRVRKAAGAFRTISEVADDIHIPQHVLRFWETKFPQVKPLKRGGGRRYYRPDDIALLRRIADLLYTQGYTIKGVQRLLREGGGKLADDIPPAPESEREAAAAERAQKMAAQVELELTLEAPALPVPPAPGATGPARDGAPAAASRRAADPDRLREAERLRAALAHTLEELLALRALLP